MHRITSANTLSSSAGQAQVPNPLPIHTALPEASENGDELSDDERTDREAWDDVPLLPPEDERPRHAFDVSIKTEDFSDSHGSTALREALASFKVAAPVTLQAISQFSHILIIMATVGRIGTDELAAVAVGWTWFNLIRSFCFGLAGALDTLGSQAFGAGNKVLVMSWSITATFSLFLVNVPVSVGMWYAGDAARVFFQQEPGVCERTATFCRFMVLGLPPWSLVTVLMKFLQVQGQMWAPALCTVCAMAVHIPSTIFLVGHLGFAGAGWAVVVMRTAHLGFTIVYLMTPLGRKYTSLEQPAKSANSEDVKSQAADVEKGSTLISTPRCPPQKGDSASSLNIPTAKAQRQDHSHSPDSSPRSASSEEQVVLRDKSNVMLHQANGFQEYQSDKLASNPQQMQDVLHSGEPAFEALQLESAQQQASPEESLDTDQSPVTKQKQHPSQHQHHSQQQHQQQHHSEQQQQQQIEIKPLPQQIQQAAIQREASGSLFSQTDGTWSLRQIVLFSLLPSRLLAFLHLGIPGGLASSVQSAAGEITTAMAGVLGTIQIDAHTTMLSVSDILFTLLGYGFAVGCTIRVGQLLGSRRPAQAKLAATVTLTVGFTAAGTVGLNMYLLSNSLGRTFTNDTRVLQVVNHIAPLLALYSCFNGSGSIISGALRGMGRQSQLMWVGIAGFWGFGVPLGYTLAFHTSLGLSGLWVGSLTGALIVAAANFAMLLRVDWQKESEKAVAKQSRRQVH